MHLHFGKQTANNDKVKPFFRAAVQADGTLEMLVYEEIGYDWWSGGGITAKTVKEQIDGAGVYSKIVLRINSPGGDAFEGIAIHNLLRSQGKPIDVYVDGLAASSASIVAMAGDTITMGRSAMMMVHNAWSFCMGYAEDMRKMADTLEKISSSIGQVYVDQTGKTAEEIQALMDAETWMSAEECVAEGFATAVAEEPEQPAALALAKQFPILAKFKKRPDGLRNEAKTKRVDDEDLAWNDFIIALDHEDISTWHLPYKFSTVEKTKAHLRDALSRFDQVKGLTKEQKHAAYSKLVRLCKQYGIQVSSEDRQRYQVWMKASADAEATCACSCEACMDGDCGSCSMEGCDDAACKENGCPMQLETENHSDLSLYAARARVAVLRATGS